MSPLEPSSQPRRSRRVYLDYNATTPVDPRVVTVMTPYFTEVFGNPASRQHGQGLDAEAAVEHARRSILRMLSAPEGSDLVFTGTATESCALAIRGLLSGTDRNASLVVSATEHHAVLDTARRLAGQGRPVTILPVELNGRIRLEALEEALTSPTALVSIIHANNELGTINELAMISALCRARGVPLHSDMTQSIGKLAVDVQELGTDLLSFSAHKFYGPKGIGALVLGPGMRKRLSSIIDGGGQEFGLRPGTVNVPGCVGMAEALRIAVDALEEDGRRARAQRLRMIERWMVLAPLTIHGDADGGLPGTLNIRFAGVPSNTLFSALRGIALSTASACSTGRGEPSHVLAAIGLDSSESAEAFRVSLGRYTSDEEIEYVCDCVIEAVHSIRGSRGAGH